IRIARGKLRRGSRVSLTYGAATSAPDTANRSQENVAKYCTSRRGTRAAALYVVALGLRCNPTATTGTITSTPIWTREALPIQSAKCEKTLTPRLATYVDARQRRSPSGGRSTVAVVKTSTPVTASEIRIGSLLKTDCR